VKRTRGGTFTIIVLLASALLLTIGGAFVDASRHLVVLGGLRERHEQAKEALVGAAAWARSAAASGIVAGETKLELSRCVVLVALKPEGDAVSMEASVSTTDGVVKANALIASRGGRWVISRFELVDSKSR
jgi:hypothetical protein